MIGTQARGAFERLMEDALKTGLNANGDPWSIQVLSDEEPPAGQKVVILTISSYLFRLMTLVHFDEDEATWRHFAGDEAGALDRQVLHDRLAECGNVICGALNRDLARVFPHVGMSTPNVIDPSCVAFLAALAPEVMRHWRIELHDGVVLHARLCICAYDHIEFDPPPTEADADAAIGELEMF